MTNHDSGALNRIRIRGFRSIGECDLELSNINVLIGSNGAGKSNFVSVFEFLSAVLSDRIKDYVGKVGLSSLLFYGPKVTEKIEIESCSGDGSYEVTAFPSADNSLHYRSAWALGYNDIVTSQNWRVYHFHDTGSTAKVKWEHNLSNNLVFMHDASNLAAFLYRLKEHYTGSYEQINAIIRLIAPFFDDFILLPNEGNNEKIVLRWRQRGCEDVFNASQLSDGTLRFACLATLLLQPAELQPSTIIIDEPELGLHPYAITIFAELVQKASLHKQIILSTQSVELLNHFEVEDVVVVNHDEKNGSRFKRLNRDALTVWLDEYTLGELWKKNVLGGRLSR